MDKLGNYSSSSRYKVIDTTEKVRIGHQLQIEFIPFWIYANRVDEQFELDKRALRREFLEKLGI